MAAWRKEFEKDAKALIRCTTGFQEEDEHFSTCLEFVTSNFRFHRFLDVDSHKVDRIIDGLCDKYTVHSKADTADTLRGLILRLLELPITQEKLCSKSDTHYSVLSLLLCLSETPTSVDFQQQVSARTQEEKDSFDWTSYLLEGIDIDTGPFPDTPPWSDDDEDENDNTSSDNDSLSTSNNQQVASLRKDLVQYAEQGWLPKADWLKNNVMTQYWSERPQTMELTNTHHTANLTNIWEMHQYSSDPFYKCADRTPLTETQAMRESLWTLGGCRQSFLYRCREHKLLLMNNIKVSHITPDALQSILQKLAWYGNITLSLHHMIDSVLTRSFSCHDNSTSEPVSRTQQAFTSALLRCLQDFNKKLASLERRLVSQEELVTLSTMIGTLQEQFGELEMLYTVYHLGVASPSTDKTNDVLTASRLLSVLYQNILQFNTLGDAAHTKLPLLLPLWIQTLRPYLEIIDGWVNKGNLIDPAREFIIQRNGNVDVFHEDFWESAFLVSNSSVHQAADTPGSSLSQISMKETHQEENLHDKNTGKEERDHQEEEFIPVFLKSVFKEIILAGKSMELLKALGKMGGRVEFPVPLYEEFVESLKVFLDVSDAPDQTCTGPSPPDHVGTAQFPSTMLHRVLDTAVKDSLLEKNFLKAIVTDSSEPEQDGTRSAVLLEGSQPVQLALQRCLYPHILQRCSTVSRLLVELLKTEYQLEDYLQAMHKFFLMEAGDAMHNFYTPLFAKLSAGEEWQDVSVLNSQLHSAIQQHHSQHADRLSVTVEASQVEETQPIDQLQCLTLCYRVPWPVDIVITSACQNVYNQVFQFLLQLKWAKYCLDELKFADLSCPDVQTDRSVESEDVPARQKQHRMHLLRLRLLHFINALHSYFMTRILYTTALEFQRELSEASDLNRVIEAHTAFLTKLYQRCMLHKKAGLLKMAVRRMLNMAVSFQTLWDHGLHNISLESLETMEDEFQKCNDFLGSFFINMSRRGSFPHMESLALSLRMGSA
ncbi:gamma-tubulin complex component 5-like isoform X1 [Branchiostoma lanceolatum]|uniref:gamma-tubulin complex component 5-like isoform X1 n=1 Tax=Branchiostoma lanceolatum TaxID=7740 RepID=UPI003451FA96